MTRIPDFAAVVVDPDAAEFYRKTYARHRAIHKSWMGRKIEKNPLDLWVYQEIVYAIRPDWIVETGSFHGGSALYLAHLCDIIGGGRVVSIDVKRYERPEHPRIAWLNGGSTDREVIESVERIVGNDPGTRVMAILDSDHAAPHVLAEMQAYGPLVSKGCYMIVEDTSINGHPTRPDFGPGPAEAVEAFLRDHPEFEPDRSCERFLFTDHPGGYLRRR